MSAKEQIDHPPHYGGKHDPYEVIKVIENWRLGFSSGNALKYIARAGKKDSTSLFDDLGKALWYLERLVDRRVPNLAPDNTVHSEIFSTEAVIHAWRLSAYLRSIVREIHCGDFVGARILLSAAIGMFKADLESHGA